MKLFLGILLASVVSFVQAQNYQILFLGNSHTTGHDIPAMVKTLLETDGSGRTLTHFRQIGANLESICGGAGSDQILTQRKWDAVVMQGASLSSSHKYKYSQQNAINMARSASRKKVPVFYFAEWPRKNWNETNYILSIYKEIKTAGGGTIIPTCNTFDLWLKRYPQAELWMGDGNHSAYEGALLAAATLYYGLFGTEHVPSGTGFKVSKNRVSEMLKIAKTVKSI